MLTNVNQHDINVAEIDVEALYQSVDKVMLKLPRSLVEPLAKVAMKVTLLMLLRSIEKPLAKGDIDGRDPHHSVCEGDIDVVEVNDEVPYQGCC